MIRKVRERHRGIERRRLARWHRRLGAGGHRGNREIGRAMSKPRVICEPETSH
jgi:formate hydrogenlyase subunit 4